MILWFKTLTHGGRLFHGQFVINFRHSHPPFRGNTATSDDKHQYTNPNKGIRTGVLNKTKVAHSFGIAKCSYFWECRNDVHRAFLWGSCYAMFSFLCSVLYIIVCSFVCFYLGHCIVCSSSSTVSDYHFDIFKLFLQLACRCLSLNIEDTAH